jgi:hypothetical protein
MSQFEWHLCDDIHITSADVTHTRRHADTQTHTHADTHTHTHTHTKRANADAVHIPCTSNNNPEAGGRSWTAALTAGPPFFKALTSLNRSFALDPIAAICSANDGRKLLNVRGATMGRALGRFEDGGAGLTSSPSINWALRLSKLPLLPLLLMMGDPLTAHKRELLLLLLQ